MSLPRKRGFSIIELVVAASIFVILSGLVFSFFRFGSRSFQQANAKHGLQTDALRTIESLQVELKRSNRSSVSLLNDTTRQTNTPDGIQQRHAICFLTLKNWNDKTNPNNYDLETQAPIWNRYLVFYATTPEFGELIRLRLDPNPAPTGAIRLPDDELVKVVHDDPKLNVFDGVVAPYVILSKNVSAFSVAEGIDSGGKKTGTYEASLKLKQKRPLNSNPGELNRPYEYYELKVSIRPENSYPNDL